MARGRKTGGRQKGSLNKATSAKAEAVADLVASIAGGDKLTPLELFAAIYQNPDADIGLRFEAAKAAAPYVHSKLASVEHKQAMASSSLNVFLVGSDGSLQPTELKPLSVAEAERRAINSSN